MGEEENPSIPVRVGKLEVSMASVKTDIRWIKLLVAPTFLVSLISLLILVASSMTH